MQHNFWFVRPYGLANQKLYYIQIYKIWRERQGMFLRMVGEYRSTSSLTQTFSLANILSEDWW